MFLSYASISPFIFKHTYQMSAMVTGELLLLMASGLVLGMLVNSWLLRHYQPKQNILIGLLLTLSANSVLLLLSALGCLNAIILVSLLFSLNLGIALILPNNAAILFSIFPTGAGLVGAVYGALRMLIAAMAGMVISALHLSTALQMSYLLLTLNFIASGAYALTFLSRGKHYTHSVKATV